MADKERSVPAIIYNPSFYLKMEGFGDYLKEEVGERFFEALKISDIGGNERVLDLGTGRGEMAVLCARAGARAAAVDYSLDSISTAKEFAAKNLSPEQQRQIEFAVMDAKKLDFPDRYFDSVFFLEILEHLYPEELQVVLSEIRRVLKPGGKLIISTGPNALLVKPLILLGMFVTGKKSWPSRIYHVNEQSYFSLKNLLDREGFRATFKVYHGKNWLYGQIYEQNVPAVVKLTAKIVNWLFDFPPVYGVRRWPLVDRVLGTHFLCLCIKKEVAG